MYLNPIDSTRTFQRLEELFWEERKRRRHSWHRIDSSSYYCRKYPVHSKSRTCRCWVCTGVRWDLFTYDEIKKQEALHLRNIYFELI